MKQELSREKKGPGKLETVRLKSQRMGRNDKEGYIWSGFRHMCNTACCCEQIRELEEARI